MNLETLQTKQVHFIGLGGSGMSGIARIMLARGISVSGSDAKDSAVLTGLETLGARVFIGHNAENIAGRDLLVVSGAISESNPELAAAQLSHIEIISRAEALALLMSNSRSVAIAGTHGKTTTTSMLTVALQQAGLDPSFAIGGAINRSGTNAHHGSGEIFVAEADESDGSFLAYKPLGAIITNIELDHVDHFPDMEAVLGAFLDFVNSIQPGGFLILCSDGPGALALLQRITRTDLQVTTYGSEGELKISHLFLSPKAGVARLTLKGKVLGEIALSIPGEHNLFNATAAIGAGLALGANFADLASGLESFSGARRRFEIRGVVNDVSIIDDYGHHPTEIKVTLETAQRFAENGRVIVIFQPHRYSRTKVFAEDFAKELSIADRVFLLEIYSAGEEPIPGISSDLIVKKMAGEKAIFEPSMLEVIEQVVKIAEPGDLIVTLGAGDVNTLAPVIINALEDKFN